MRFSECKPNKLYYVPKGVGGTGDYIFQCNRCENYVLTGHYVRHNRDKLYKSWMRDLEQDDSDGVIEIGDKSTHPEYYL